MSKKADKINDSSDDSVDSPEPPPTHVGAEDVPPGTPAPRAARFGEGGEGGGGRRERGLAGPRTGFVARTSQFLRDVRAEMKRVSWPTFNEVKNTTIITLIAVIFFAVYLFAVDQGLAFLITQLTRLVEWIAGVA
ncbi:MAG TPA: preprotein translocase subunit SecE [Pyrinomonadaceae bacterium]